MSHFSVAVILEDLNKLDDVMSMFYRDTCMCSPSALSFVDVTSELEEEYRTDTIEIDGEDVNIKDAFEDLQKYAKFMGIQYYETYGTYGYYTNLNGKFDGYRVGGRFRNLLKAKAGKCGTYYLWEPIKEQKDGYFDIAQIKDIDFRFDCEKYNKMKRIWDVCMEGAPLDSGESEGEFSYYPKAVLEEYETKENFAFLNSTINVSAVITPDRVWHDADKSGAFVSSWSGGLYNRFFRNMNDEYYIVIVDVVVDCSV